MGNLSLISLIIELYQKLNGKEPDRAIKESIDEMIEGNALDLPNNTPSWFIGFWQNIINYLGAEPQRY
ncbi:MAG TPA: hypothetical protein VF691_00040 [Cytophagaceae bacterium]|jgi:hypothetical protein